MLTLANELGIDGNSLICNGNDTYTPILESKKAIIERHCKEQQEKFGITITDDNRVLPRIFWNPKLHKTPFGARFIAGARNCSTKQLSKLVNLALQEVMVKFKKYCATIQRRVGINCDWDINSTTQVLEKIEKYKEQIYNAQVYDFSTLYTNLELEDVKTAMKGMLDLIFNEGSQKYLHISLYKKKSFFSKKASYSSYDTFKKETLLEAVYYILDNAYVEFGEYILKQDRGIPMGGNSSTEIARCTLGWYEFSFMTSLYKDKERKNRNWNLAKRLSNNSRYIDDLIAINYEHFGNIFSRIYPKSLLMKRVGDNNKNLNYLDLNIVIKDGGGFITRVFCKQDEFDFPVVQYSFPSGNMPQEIGHNIFYGQILRFARICTKKEDFITSTKKIFDILIERGYKEKPLLKKLDKAYGRNFTIPAKFEIFDNRDLNKLICDTP